MATCITKGPLIYAYLTNGIQTRKPCLFKNLSTVNCFQTTSIEPNSQDIKTMQ